MRYPSAARKAANCAAANERCQRDDARVREEKR